MRTSPRLDEAHGKPGRRLIAGLLWQERRTVAATVAFSVAAAALEGVGIGLLIPLLQSITDPAAAPLASGVGWIDQWVLAVGAPPLVRLYRVSAAIFVSIVLRSALAFGGQVASIATTERILHRLRMRVFDVLIDVPLRYVATHRAGHLLNTATTELQRLRYLFVTVSNMFIRGLVLVAYAVLALWLSWQLTAIALVLMAALSLSLKRLVERTRDRGRVIAEANGGVAAVVTEVVHGMRTVKAFVAEPFERGRFHRASERAATSMYRSGAVGAAVRPIGEALASGVLVGLVVVSVRLLVAGGSMTVPSLLAFLFAIFRLLPIVHDLNHGRGVLANLHGSWTHVLAFLDRADKAPLPSGERVPGGLREGLRLDGVTFAYEPGQPVLRAVSFEVRRGQTVALVGASGAGKSTLVDLVPRFADPDAGAILWDGVDLRAFDLAALRAQVAVVSQDTFLFHDTVTANIAYGVAHPDPARLEEVARQANALEFIEALPDGFETLLGDRGVRLSGGQRQRIAIARALYRDPEVLLLDEATSALDSVSERLIQDSLEKLMVGRTAIVVAHRLSTVESADLVVVLEEGEVVEVGTYEELVARRGRLWEFHRLQSNLVAA